MKQKLLVLAIAAVLAGCGGDDDNDSPATGGTGGSGGGTGGGGTTTTEITGSAMAPGGGIAQFRQESPFQLALNFLISPAAAAITGLSPVANQEVRLVRIDNNGDQVGDVIDTATTDAQGAYTLELPSGQELGGDLVVEIAGTGTAKMRAQVLSEEVDVTPVTEFVLQKLIASDADLAAVSSEAVTTLTAQIEQLDLDGSTDLTSLLADLDAVAGELVADSVEVIVGGQGDADTVAGEYRNVAVQWGMEHNVEWGANYAIDSWVTDIALNAGENGLVTFQLSTEDNSFGSLNLNHSGLWHEGQLEQLDETIEFNLGSTGVLSFSRPEEVEIDGAVAQVSPPKIYKFRQVPGSDVFVLEAHETSNFFNAVDATTVGDEYVGQEFFRGFEFLMRKPTSATNASLTGAFGRVYLGSYIFPDNQIELESEQNVITFDGNGALSISAADQYTVWRQVDLLTNDSCIHGVDVDCPPAEEVTYQLAADGSFSSIGDATGTNIFVNEGFDLLVGNETEVIDENQDGNLEEYGHSLTLAVKLPTSAPTIGEKVYRVLQVETDLSGGVGINMIRESSMITMEGQNAATFTGTLTDLQYTSGLERPLVAESEVIENLAAVVSVGANGAATFSFSEEGEEFTLEGFFNEDGTFGVFQTRYNQSGTTDPLALGVAVLIEVTE